MAAFLSQVLPPGTEDHRSPVSLSWPAASHPDRCRGAAVAVAAYSSVIKSLMDGFNAAYHVPRNRSAFAHIGVGIMLVFLIVIPMLGASSLILFGEACRARRHEALESAIRSLNPLRMARSHSSSASCVMASHWEPSGLLPPSFGYYFGPYRKQRWRDIWAGALLATFLWLLATLVFSWYVTHIAHYNVLYGSIGTSIALLIWMYLLAYHCALWLRIQRRTVRTSNT